LDLCWKEILNENQRSQQTEQPHDETCARSSRRGDLDSRGTNVEQVSVITDSSARELDLKEGADVYAIIKAGNFMIGTD